MREGVDKGVLVVGLRLAAALSGDENRLLRIGRDRSQWELIELRLPAAKKLGRKRTSLRKILNALLYIAKAGCQWRLLPVDFPPWQTVYAMFRKWIAEGVWERVNARLRARVRAKAGKRCWPTAAILDSQSVKSSPHGGEVGYDAGKKIKGRKRHILVDTMGQGWIAVLGWCIAWSALLLSGLR